jgi:hypothetical protein
LAFMSHGAGELNSAAASWARAGKDGSNSSKGSATLRRRFM